MLFYLDWVHRLNSTRIMNSIKFYPKVDFLFTKKSKEEIIELVTRPEVNSDFLLTTHHANCWVETAFGDPDLFPTYHLAIPSKIDLQSQVI